MKGQFPVDMLKKALELVLVCTDLDLNSLTLKMTVVVQAMHYLTSHPNAMVSWPWAENNPVVFTLHQLQGAINNFTSDKRGSSPLVSEGRLQCGQLVAIKRLEHENRKMVYDLEVHTLTRLRHPNIINLIGYCAEGEERFFVYEFMRLGSLFDQLHARKPEERPLDWSARMKIGAGVANALNHLHNKARPRLIYGDLKPSNILLSNGLIPKLSDFGIAKFALFGNQSSPTTSPYWAPERTLTGRLTFKSDVYNFGMVLLEIITGCADKSYIPIWVRREDQCIELAADPELKGQFSADMVMKALEVVSRCVDEDPDSRPNMGDVLGAMNYLASCDGDPGEMAWPVEFDLLPGVQLE
ncbi:hypothetical protein OROHE_021699 [Orobanche hederae]